jgi:putative Mg2+ transporter-C (MgtC) family protein
MFHAVFTTALLLAVNSILHPLSRYIDRRSLAVWNTHALYLVRLLCDQEHQAEAEYQINRSIAAREIHAEKVQVTDNILVRAICGIDDPRYQTSECDRRGVKGLALGAIGGVGENQR